jgi:hypothetical protein
MSSFDTRVQNYRPTQLNSTEDASSSFAIVTPTFWRDLARCELLVESLDQCAPDMPHYLIVDRRDRSTFAHLERGKHKIIDSEELLGNRFWRIPGNSGLWLSLKTPPVRGWILQQIKKIAAIEVIPQQTLMFCDSDTALFRRFHRSNFLVDGKIGLLDVNWDNEDVRRWTATARRLLGLPHHEGGYHNHVGYIICWNRETIEAMQQRIEKSTGTHWQLALARTATFSEYMLYGIFVRELLGYGATNHAPSDVPLVKGLWGSINEDQIDDLFARFDSRTVAIMIHSKGGPEPHHFRHHLEGSWRLLENSPAQRFELR